MAGKKESFSMMKPCGTGSMEAEGAVTGEEGSLAFRAGKEKYTLQPCSQEGGSKSLEEFFSLKPCTHGGIAAAKAFSGKEFSLNRCTSKSMVGINGKKESLLKLRTDERMNMEALPAEEQWSLKLCPTEQMSMNVVTAEEEYSLKICPTKRKAPRARHLHALQAGASKRKVGDYCFQGGDIAATDAVLSKEMGNCADATVEGGETKSLQFRGDSFYDSEDDEVEEEVDEEEGDDNKEEDVVRIPDGNLIISDEEFQLTLAENNEIVKKYVQDLFVGRDWGLSKSMDIFLGSDDEGEVVLDDARVDVLE